MKHRGFTLSEILVVALILAVLLGGLLMALVQARSTFQATDILVKLQADNRLATRRILSDLRRVTYPYRDSIHGITITQNSPFGGSDTIMYYLPTFQDATGTVSWGPATRIRLNPDGTRNLIKENLVSGDITVLAENVAGVNFVDHTINPTLYLNELKINLRLEKADTKGITHSVTSTSTVDMRN